MRKQYPLVIGRKERYASGDNTLFREWARNSKGQFSTPEDEDRDAAVAAKAEAFLRANPFAVLFAAQLDQGKPWWKAWRGPYLVASDLGWRTMTARTGSGLEEKSNCRVSAPLPSGMQESWSR